VLCGPPGGSVLAPTLSPARSRPHHQRRSIQQRGTAWYTERGSAENQRTIGDLRFFPAVAAFFHGRNKVFRQVAGAVMTRTYRAMHHGTSFH